MNEMETENVSPQRAFVDILLEIARENKEFRNTIFLELYGEDIETAIQREREEQSIPAETDVT